MAEVKTQAQREEQAVTIEAGEFASLLQKEFRPKTDRARTEVENAVRTLAEQALASTVVVSEDVIRTVEAIIAEIDKKLNLYVALAVLAGTALASVQRALRATPDVLAKAAVDLMLGANALGHLLALHELKPR